MLALRLARLTILGSAPARSEVLPDVIIIEVLVILVVVALLIAGTPFLARKLLHLDPKRKELEAAHLLDEQGEVNTVKFTLDQMRRCVVCERSVDPRRDLRVSAAWVHSDCYMTRELEKHDKKDKQDA